MSKQQLYINGEAVDMPAEQIKIKVESNLFSDAGSIMTAHSYSIALPRTMTNDSVMGNAYIPGADTGGVTTHRWLEASLYMDGVPLFVNGRAALNKVDDKGYNINLYWGLLGVFEYIKEEGLDLCDLPASTYWRESYAKWIWLAQYDGSLPQYVSGMDSDTFNRLDSDSKELARRTPWLLPSEPAIYILSKVMQVYGISLSMSDTCSDRIEQLWHPLTSRNAMAKGETMIVNAIVQMINKSVSGAQYVPSFVMPTTDSQGHAQWAALPIPDSPSQFAPSATNATIANACVKIVNGHLHADTSHMTALCDVKIAKVRFFGTLPYPAVIYIPSLNNRAVRSVVVSGQHTYDVEINESFSVNYGEVIFRIADEWDEPDTESKPGTLNIQMTLEAGDDVTVAHPWDYVRNYPAVGVIAYLSELLAHVGGCVVGSTAEPNSLRLATIDEIVDADPVELDTLGVKSVTMTFDKLAQKNRYLHKENDDTGTKDVADGVIYTADGTLSLERKAFESKFKVPLHSIVKLWKVDDDKASWNNAGDYIAGFIDAGNVIANTGQDFQSVISQYWQHYEAMVRHPKVVEATVRLSVLELINFDFGKPVYIKQLNRSYLVKTIESDSGDNYKLTLVQI